MTVPLEVTAQQLKYGGNQLVEWLTKIMNLVWFRGLIPDDWFKELIIPVWKGKGNKSDCKNFRGITLLSVTGKAFMHVLIIIAFLNLTAAFTLVYQSEL